MGKPPIEVGRLVISLKGRDAGRPFIVLNLPDETHANITDGDLRKVEHPKRKKLMHLKPKSALIAITPNITNSDVRKAIAATLNQIESIENKEDCALG